MVGQDGRVYDKGDRPFEFQNSTPDREIDLAEAVFQTLGYASGCWDNLMGAGVFHSQSAKSAGEKLLDLINERLDGSYAAGKAINTTSTVIVRCDHEDVC